LCRLKFRIAQKAAGRGFSGLRMGLLGGERFQGREARCGYRSKAALGTGFGWPDARETPERGYFLSESWQSGRVVGQFEYSQSRFRA